VGSVVTDWVAGSAEGLEADSAAEETAAEDSAVGSEAGSVAAGSEEAAVQEGLEAPAGPSFGATDVSAPAARLVSNRKLQHSCTLPRVKRLAPCC
jgi:hypothetical protein